MRTFELLVGCLLMWLATQAQGSEPVALLTLGVGPQVGADQTNRTIGVDINVLQFERSPRQQLSLGLSYTYLESSRGPNKRLHAWSVYPQLMLIPKDSGWARSWLPESAEPYFFVRALGPSYLSDNSLGERQQDNHFAFQAQLGVGVTFAGSNGSERRLSISWKHFSNANLFSDNDGIDVPLVLSYGFRF